MTSPDQHHTSNRACHSAMDDHENKNNNLYRRAIVHCHLWLRGASSVTPDFAACSHQSMSKVWILVLSVPGQILAMSIWLTPWKSRHRQAQGFQIADLFQNTPLHEMPVAKGCNAPRNGRYALPALRGEIAVYRFH